MPDYLARIIHYPCYGYLEKEQELSIEIPTGFEEWLKNGWKVGKVMPQPTLEDAQKIFDRDKEYPNAWFGKQFLEFMQTVLDSKAEVWFLESPVKYWENMHGRYYYVLVKDGRVSASDTMLLVKEN